ncbi:hypothetical protein F7725_017337 [Dissostichus mawsoni]|uniref:Cytochrome c oxidase assembly protein COX14 n=2 Tax=Nototheniidae TaxID=8206 RepID=A0A7J5Z496_DISMA|nr:hypothetical protein F7725_017337 [Dissostichus mawsoni]
MSFRILRKRRLVSLGANFTCLCADIKDNCDFTTCDLILNMVSGKRIADFGYRTFTASMMLLSVYGGYMCVMRGYRFVQKQKQLKLAAENQEELLNE